MIEVIDRVEQVPRAPLGSRIAKRVWASAWPKLLAIAIVLGSWQLTHLSGWKKYVLPGPGPTLASLWDQASTHQLWSAIGTTVQRALLGFALAVLIGTVIGTMVARIAPLRAAVGSLITGLQTLPSVVMIPFALILFGINTSAILFVMVIGAAPSVANGLISGIDYTPPLLLRAGKMMGLRRVSLYRYLILPASLPSFVAGLRQGWAFSWRGLMAGELLVNIADRPSLGVLLSTNEAQLNMADLTAIIIVILILGILAHAVFEFADHTIRRRWGLEVQN